MHQHSQRDLQQWLDKHRTPDEVTWAIAHTLACIDSLTDPRYGQHRDEWELALHRARLSALRAKALVMGISIGE